MHLKNLNLFLLSLYMGILLIGQGIDAKTNKVLHNVNEFDQSKWIKFKNKYSWEISLPSCWSVEGAEDAKAKDSTWTYLQPSSSCKLNFSRITGMQVVLPSGIKSNSPASRITSEEKLRQSEHKDSFRSDVLLGSKKVPALTSIYVDETPGQEPLTVISWSIHSNCDNKNLRMTVMYDLTRDEKDNPLSQQKLPPLFEKILSTFICTKP